VCNLDKLYVTRWLRKQNKLGQTITPSRAANKIAHHGSFHVIETLPILFKHTFMIEEDFSNKSFALGQISLISILKLKQNLHERDGLIYCWRGTL